jgi:hypothetical protein
MSKTSDEHNPRFDFLRCGTPDCDWGFPVSDFTEEHINERDAQFRQHCIERHGLDPADTEAHFFLDLNKRTLTLLKQK